MTKICKVTFNNQPFLVNCGDLLLDGALMSGVELPHDCRSGICGSCRVRLVDGKVFGGIDESSGMIHACQARVVSDLKIVAEPTPDTVSIPARVSDLIRLAPDVVGVGLELQQPFRHLPGQGPRSSRHHPGGTGRLDRGRSVAGQDRMEDRSEGDQVCSDPG